MRVLLIVSAAILVQARPETGGGGYNYRPSFGAGLAQGGGSFGGSSGFQHSISSSTSGSFGSTGFGASGIGVGGSGGFVSSGGSFGGGSAGFIQGGPTLVQKHIYVHVPPPEPEDLQPQRQVSIGTAQKHYKIIFIKAPSYQTQSQQQIALAAQNQEKTIVYVLVKKPDDIGDISLPSIAPTQPSKPEVYFIKYKTQKQSTGGGAGISSIGSSGAGISGPGLGIGTIGGGSSSTSISGGAIGIGGGVISSGSASSSIGGGVGGIPATQYGPPGKSGPY